MQSIKSILQSFNPAEDKYISREFQKYGYDLSEELGDFKHTALYIKLAKTVPRPILERARNFVKDAGNVKSKPRLFMWKMAQLRREWRGKQQGQVKNNKPSLLGFKRLHLFVCGKVVGVGFRAWLVSQARKAGVTGWARNTFDGKVEILLEGERKVVDDLAVLCKKGPVSTRVTSVICEEG